MQKQLAMADSFFGIRLATANHNNVQIQVDVMNLSQAQEGKEYIIRGLDTDDEELNAFLFSLGCYSGEPITVIARRRGSYVVSIKDGRYNIDKPLAEAILI